MNQLRLTATLAERLGHAPDAKLLIVNCDDLGSTRAANVAAYEALRKSRTVRTGPVQPSGGVGGTRVGIKCLHAHLANFLTGAADPVGQLVADAVGVPELVMRGGD